MTAGSPEYLEAASFLLSAALIQDAAEQGMNCL